jgi:hypothetical protein
VHQSLRGMSLGKLERAMSKKDLTEQEIRSQYIRPAIVAAVWKMVETKLDDLLSVVFNEVQSSH